MTSHFTRSCECWHLCLNPHKESLDWPAAFGCMSVAIRQQGAMKLVSFNVNECVGASHTGSTCSLLWLYWHNVSISYCRAPLGAAIVKIKQILSGARQKSESARYMSS